MNPKSWALLAVLVLALIGYTLMLEAMTYVVYRRWGIAHRPAA